MNITAFLLARIAEDEAIARAAGEVAAPPWRWAYLAHPYKYGLVGRHPVQPRLDALVVPSKYPDAYPDKATAAHIARWDPARLLAECEAKRRIVDRCGGSLESDCGEYERAFALTVLRELATPYADHPDYDGFVCGA